MGFAPSFWAIDSYDLPVAHSTQVEELEQLWPVLDALQTMPERPNIRIKRLVDLLVRRFPASGDVADAGGEPSVWEDGIVPNAAFCGMSSYWAAPLDARHTHSVLPDAVTWARELFLDIFDDEFGVYVPFRGRPVPMERGIQYMQAFFRKDARLPWKNSLALRQALIERLTLLLSPVGFVFSPDDTWDARFVRPIADGMQTIAATIFGEDKALRCRLFVSQTSQVIADVLARMEKAQPEQSGAPTRSLATLPSGRVVLGDQLDVLRGAREEGWLDERTGLPWITFAGTRFWLDWMMDDLAQWVVPMLDQAATLEGVVRVIDGDAYPWLHRNTQSKLFSLSDVSVVLNALALLVANRDTSRATALANSVLSRPLDEVAASSLDGQLLLQLAELVTEGPMEQLFT